MTTDEEYRSYARECIRWAGEAKTEFERNAFLDMACAWAMAATEIANGKAIASSMMQPPGNDDLG
jgi:hypothetical protein